MNIVIRKARAEDAEPLTGLAFRSKAHWGYPEAFMKAFAPELVITGAYLASAPVFVAEVEGAMAGFAGLSAPGLPPELIFLFIDPPFIGRGCGDALWLRSLEEARLLRWKDFTIVSDPHAERFYIKRGASRVGEKAFPSAPDRVVPVLRVDLAS